MTSKTLNARLFKNFSKLNREQRLQQLIAIGALTADDVQYLNTSVDNSITELADQFVENVIGCFQLPLGIAANFCIDSKDYAIPMAVEETSIIAAASATAKWIKESGEITTEIIGENIIGQIQIAKVKNYDQLKSTLLEHKQQLIDSANQKIVPNFVARGGGVKDITLRNIDRGDGQQMAIIHVHLNPCDAMGANVITQVCEFLKHPIEKLSGENVTMCILSNLADTKLTRVTVKIFNIDPILGENISEASLFAELDPYRAATHNKGILNGIDPVLIATGNDWRAVEAGIHAYAARDGQYRAISKWRMAENDLIGTFEAPLIVGTVGGVTKLHPTAQLSLRILGIEQAGQLSRIAATVGLVQNLGAIKALTTDGIVKGHMKLHIRNLLLAVNATQHELIWLQKKAESFFNAHKKITMSDVKNLLLQLRNELTNSGKTLYET
jgi:hydroxymethylglutaryl-CoA reductase